MFFYLSYPASALLGLFVAGYAALLAVKSVGKCDFSAKAPAPVHEPVKLRYTEDLSGRFEVDYAYRNLRTGQYYAMVSAKRKDLPIMEQVYAGSLEELEEGVEKAYKILEEEWKLEMDVRRLLYGKSGKKKRRRRSS